MQKSLTLKQQQLHDFDYENGLKDLFFFEKRICGYSKMEVKPHRESCALLEDRTLRHKLYLGPRGCYKTTQVSQGYPVQRICENPNIRILLDSVSLSNSKKNLAVIQDQLRYNKRLIALYGAHYSSNIVWNTEEFVSALRTNKNLKERTVTACGIDKTMIGQHFDLIIADDLHDVQNCKTVEQIEKVKQHIKLLFPLLDPGGEMIIAGTRWNYTDAFSMLLGDTEDAAELELSKLFKKATLIKPCIDDQGNLYFPKQLTHEHIAETKIAMGRELFAAQMMNEPVLSGEFQKFQERYFKRYKALPELRFNYLTVDPGGEKKKSDEWVLFDGSCDAEGKRYFYDFLKKTMTLTMAADEIYKRWKKNKYKKIGFEVSGQQGVILTSIKDYIWATYQEVLPFVELIHSKDSKAERIEAMSPYYTNGKILHSPKMSEPFGLEDQLMKFPKGADDVADAAAMQMEMPKGPKVKIVIREPKNLEEMITKNINDRVAGKTNQIQRSHPILGSDY